MPIKRTASIFAENISGWAYQEYVGRRTLSGGSLGPIERISDPTVEVMSNYAICLGGTDVPSSRYITPNISDSIVAPHTINLNNGAFTSDDVGRTITITGMSNHINNGRKTILSVVGSTQITVDLDLEDETPGVVGVSWQIDGPNNFYIGFRNSTIYHYNHGVWETEIIDLSRSVFVQSIWAVSQDDVWAGVDQTSGGGTGTGQFLYHWDGNSWEPVSLPAYPNTSIRSIHGTAWNDIWAGGTNDSGYGVLFHYDGISWTVNRTFSDHFYSTYVHSLQALSPSSLWLVADADVWHWNGSAWSRWHLPYMSAMQAPASIRAFSDTDVWASGMGHLWAWWSDEQCVWHWNGSTWTETYIGVWGTMGEHQSDGGFIGGIATNNLWVTGTFSKHWNGSTWTHIPCFPVSVAQEVFSDGSVLRLRQDGSLLIYSSGHFRPFDYHMPRKEVAYHGFAYDVDNNAIAALDAQSGSIWRKDSVSWYVDGPLIYNDGDQTNADARAISAYDANNLIVVGGGGYGIGGVIWKWNGSVWATIGESYFSSREILIDAYYESLTSIWVMSAYALYHWNGTSWSEVYRPSVVGCVGFKVFGSHIFVASQSSTGSFVAHSSSGIGGPFVQEAVQLHAKYSGIWGASWDDVWVIVGWSDNYNISSVNSMHYNGTSWTSAPTAPKTGYTTSNKVIAGINANDIMVIVQQDGRARRWNGTSWEESGYVASIGSVLTDGTDYACMSGMTHLQIHRNAVGTEWETSEQHPWGYFSDVVIDQITEDIYVTIDNSYISTPGTIMHWNSSGWEYIRVPAESRIPYGLSQYIAGMWAYDGEIWAVTGEGKIYHRDIYGIWHLLIDYTVLHEVSNVVSCKISNLAYVCFDQHILRWSDGDFTFVANISYANGNRIFLDSSTLWIYNWLDETTLYYYTNGLHYIPNPSGEWGTIGFLAASGNKVMMIGSVRNVRTSNKFTSWEELPLPSGTTNISFVWSDPSGRFYCSASEDPAFGIYSEFYTDDMGDNWYSLGTPVGLGPLIAQHEIYDLLVEYPDIVCQFGVCQYGSNMYGDCMESEDVFSPPFITNEYPADLQTGVDLLTSISANILDNLDILSGSVRAYINDELVFDGSSFIYPYYGTVTPITQDGYSGCNIVINKTTQYLASTWTTVRLTASNIVGLSVDESWRFLTKTSIKQVEQGPYEITFDVTFTGPMYDNEELTNSANYKFTSGAYARRIDKLANDKIRIWSEYIFGQTSFDLTISSNVKDSYGISIVGNTIPVIPFYSSANLGNYNGLIRTYHNSRFVSADSQRIYLAGSKGVDVFKKGSRILNNRTWAQIFDAYGIDSMFVMNYPNDISITDTHAPYISYALPGDGETAFPSSHILFVITDAATSVELSSVTIYINNVAAFRGNYGGWQDGFCGNIGIGYKNIGVDIWTTTPFVVGDYITVRIIASDLMANVMDHSYTFEVIAESEGGWGFGSWGFGPFGGV